MVYRYDASPIKARRDAAGFLRGSANLSRVGVLAYRQADGSVRRELRHPDEVFKADSLASLALVPMTLGHPSGGAPVTAQSARGVVIGAIGETVKQDGRFIRAPYVIHDDAAINEIESGRQRELSCGYSCDLDSTPGEYEGERYDAIQRNIAYNHVAVLARGRAGSDVRIDSADVEAFDDTNARNAHEGKPHMKTIRIDGVDYEIGTPAFDQAWAKHEAKRAEDLAAAKKEADAQRARADGLAEKVQALEASNAPAQIEKRIADRVALLTHASKILGSDFKADGKTDDEIKRACILKASPKANLEKASVDYVNARFDGVIESFDEDAASESVAGLRADVAMASGTNADDLDDAEAHAAMVKRNRGAWQNKSA